MSGFGNQAFGSFSFGGLWTNPNAPNLADFTSFIYDSVLIPVSALPITSPWPGYAFARAQALTPCYPQISAIEFVMATYNCGAHMLIKIAVDQPGQTYFTTARNDMRMLEPQIGIVQSSSDESTSNSFAIGDGMRNMTITDMDFYRTPWGRDFLGYLQDGGPSVWGLS